MTAGVWLIVFLPINRTSLTAIAALLLFFSTACTDTAVSPTTTMTPTLNANKNTALPDGFDVEGHRGARGLKPENTLPAFETALDLGVTTLELDVHFTADHVVVIWHDPVLSPDKCRLDMGQIGTTYGPDDLEQFQELETGLLSGNVLISQLAFEELKLAPYTCDLNPDPGLFPEQNSDTVGLASRYLPGTPYRVVSLAQIFDFVDWYSQSAEKTPVQQANAQRVQFNIETKREPEHPETINDGFDGVQPGPLELAILDLIAERGLEDRVIIQSFDHRSVWAIRRVNSTVRLAALTSRIVPQLAEYAANGVNIWSPRFSDVTPQRLAEAHEVGLRVVPWTVNDAADMRRLIEMGVDGIISDRPDILLGLKIED